MKNHIEVESVAELKKALNAKPSGITITNPTLAAQVKLIKLAGLPAIGIAMAGMGIGLSMAWNPIGVGLTALSMTTSEALVAAIAFFITTLGIAVLVALIREWEIDAAAEAKVTDPKDGKIQPAVNIGLKIRPKNKGM